MQHGAGSSPVVSATSAAAAAPPTPHVGAQAEGGRGGEASTSASSLRRRREASREVAVAGSDVDPAEWAKLTGIQRRIQRLIGGYTGGASKHSSFLRHFDQERSTPAALASATGGSSTGGMSTVRLAEDEAKRDKQAFLNL